jgi:hypothetical protein
VFWGLVPCSRGPCLRDRSRATKGGPGGCDQGLVAGEGSTDAMIGVVVAAGMMVAKTDQDRRR